MALDNAQVNQILDTAAVIGKGLFDLISAAITARADELSAINSRLADTLAAMRGEKTTAHATVESSIATLKAELEAMKAAQVPRNGLSPSLSLTDEQIAAMKDALVKP